MFNDDDIDEGMSLCEEVEFHDIWEETLEEVYAERDAEFARLTPRLGGRFADFAKAEAPAPAQATAKAQAPAPAQSPTPEADGLHADDDGDHQGRAWTE